MHTLRAWMQAVRPLAQVNIAIPLVLGHAMAFAWTGRFAPARLLWIHAFGLLLQCFVVLANDYADREGDRENTTFNRFSGGSRVIPESKLSAATVRAAALVALAALAVFGLAALLAGHGPWLLAGAGASAALLWAYSYPPLRLAYRGGGEWAQGVGVGVVLPLVAFGTHTDGAFELVPWLALVPVFLVGTTSNILTSLPDYPADKAVHKRTYAVTRGQWAARRHVLELLLLAACATPLVLPGLALPWAAVVATPALALALWAVPLLGSADAENHDECQLFIVRAGAALNVLLLSWALALVVTALLSS